MRQTHLAGDKLFVDYAGDKLGVVIDRRTGERRAAHIFVAVMGASSLSFACATWTETLADWTDAHRSEEHTSELQSLMRISYAVFCLKKKKKLLTSHTTTSHTSRNHMT